MLKRLVLWTALLCGSTAAWADSKSDCADWENSPADRSITACTTVILDDAIAAWAYVNRGIAYEAKGEPDRAIADYDKAIEIDTKYARAYNSRGIAYRKKGDLDRAIAGYSKAIELDPKYSRAYNNRGYVYEVKGEHDLAIADFTKVIEIEPKYAVAYNNRGYAYEAKGDIDRAISDYTRAIEIDPKYARAFTKRGGVYEAKGEHDRAIIDYDKAIEIDPKYAPAYDYRGDAYKAKGDLDKAIADYTQAIELNPRSATYFNDRGYAYEAKGEHDRAIADYDKAIEIDPKNARVLINRGDVYEAKGEHDRAIIDYDKAIEIDPKNALAYFNRGIACEAKGEHDLAIADFTKVIEIEPKYAVAYNNRGYAYGGKGERDRAISDYDKAIEIDPKNTLALINRGDVYESKGEHDRAIADYTKVIEIEPKHALAYFNRGIAYETMGEHDRAIDDFTKVIEIEPKVARAYNNRGYAYEGKGEHERAIAEYAKAIEIDPMDALAFMNRGVAYEDKDEYGRAIVDFTKVIEIEPKHALAYFKRGIAYEAKGEHDLAIADYTKVIEIDPKYGPAYLNRGYAYGAKGEHDRAIADYDKAIEIGPKQVLAYYNRGYAYEAKGDYDRALADYNRAVEIRQQPQQQKPTTATALGTDLLDVTKAEADKLGWDASHGAKLGVVASRSPAEKAGLKSGDIILSIDRIVIDSSSDMDATIAAKRAGDQLRLQVLSGGRERHVTLTLSEGSTAQAVQKEPVPQLMVDAGGHTARINALAYTPDGKQLISAGDDKVIRVWDWQAGKTVRTIRGQAGPGSEGKIYAMALSPDGHWLAAGGHTHKECRARCGEIRLYEFATGNLVGLLKGHTSIVFRLSYSPDGRRLISGSADKTAIIWDVESKRLLHRLKGHKASVDAVAFTPDGALAITGGNDFALRLWRVSDGELITEMKGSTQLRAIAVRSPDRMIASADVAGEIRLWDGDTGQYLRTLANQDGYVTSLRFSLDGLWLLSTCGPGCSHAQHVWEVATGRELVAYTGHDNSVYASAASPEGRFVATSGFNGDVQVWDLKTGETKRKLIGTGAPGWAAGFSADGQRIAWGNADPCPRQEDCPNQPSALQFQLTLPGASQSLGRPEPIKTATANGFVRVRTTYGSYELSHRKGVTEGYENAILDVKKDGHVLASTDHSNNSAAGHRTYSFTPDGQTIISGGNNGYLAAYDLRGRRIGNFVGHETEVWAVTLSPDGRLLVSASADQTIRIWNLKTRELIVTLFNGTDGEWVMWTPQGYYTGSPGADKIVGWQINKGPDQVPDYIGAEQLRQHLNRPDIVERSIILASAEQAVQDAPGTTFRLADLLKRPVPRFKIVAPLSGATERDGRTTVKIAIEATPDPIKAIRVQVNGRQIKVLTPEIGAGGFPPGELLLDVPLAKGRNEVRVTLTNAIGEKAETLSISHEGDGDLDKRGTLYIVAIGVDKYPGLGNRDLRFSGADARALVEAAEKRLAPNHTNVVKRVLVNGVGADDNPTAANIHDAIDLLKQAKETDTVLLFIAGHGFNDGPNYRFLATDAKPIGNSFSTQTVISWHDLQEAVEAAKGRRILLIDTCHAGNAYNQRIGNAAYHANIIAYTAARFDQEAKENATLGHGLFTYAVVEGLNGKGELGAKQWISTKDLADYVVKRVEQLAKALDGEQEPQYFKGRDAEDYVLARGTVGEGAVGIETLPSRAPVAATVSTGSVNPAPAIVPMPTNTGVIEPSTPTTTQKKTTAAKARPKAKAEDWKKSILGK